MSITLNAEDYTILIVDDNDTNLSIISDYLRSYNFQILVAQNGERAIKTAKDKAPDLILLDVMMPGLSGFDTCKKLKSQVETQDIPVVFITALSNTEAKLNAFESGGADYVSKPFQREEIFIRVTNQLKIRNLTRQLQNQLKREKELRQIEAQKAQELVELNANKDKFFSIVAHDLKGPFNPVLGLTELMASMADQFSPAEIQEMSRGIYQAARNVYDLLDNLLQWSRIQGGRLTYDPVNVDLVEIVDRNVKLLKQSAIEKNIQLYNYVNSPVFAYADENMVFTIIRNLSSNAMKFTPIGGAVSISAHANEAKQVEIAISDTGIGISPQDQEKLFKMDTHHTTRGTNEEQGTGLGLILCKEMVERNTGELWIESVVEQGTTVKFTLPSHKPNA